MGLSRKPSCKLPARIVARVDARLAGHDADRTPWSCPVPA